MSKLYKKKAQHYFMRKTVFTLLFYLIGAMAFAQLTPEQRIQDSVIGWWSNNKFDNTLKPSTDPVQKKRIDITNLFVDWMKKTYTPVGGLGTVTRQNFSVRFGVYFMVWNVSFSKEYLDDKGHFKPIDEENTPFGITANNIPASYAVKFLNSDGKYYFTWPPDGYFDWEMYKGADPRIHPNVYKYTTHINELHTVFLAPNNQLPFVPVSKGEYLNAAEASMDKELQLKKDQINSQWSDPKSREDAYQYQQKEFDRYRKAITKWKEKYKDQLNEPAVLRNMQPTIISDFFGDMDPFAITDIERNRKQYFPLYKVPADVMEKCKTAQPQWISVWFRYNTKENGNQLHEMYTALTQNLNYDYIYNYFFDPEKVKGLAYKPTNEAQLKARLDAYRKKNATAINPVASASSKYPDAFFFDDFSSGTEGGDPSNWYFKRYGKHAIVSTIKNQEGKWLKLGYGTPVTPSLLKKPLPENFTLEYDIATDGGFGSRTGGAATLSLNTRKPTDEGVETLGGNGTTITVKISSGNEADYDNNNYRGELSVKINSTPSANTQNGLEGVSYEYPLKEFTNKKTSIHVMIKVKAGVVTIFINDKMAAVSTNFKMGYGGKCVSCSLPVGTKFNFISWTNTTTDSDNINVYMSNVKIINQ
jgi:hypothetical protein